MALRTCGYVLILISLLQFAISWEPEADKSHHVEKRAEDRGSIFQVENHIYYKATFYSTPLVGTPFWMELSEKPEAKVIQHSDMNFDDVKRKWEWLSFDFPFYGDLMRRFKIGIYGYIKLDEAISTDPAVDGTVVALQISFNLSKSESAIIRYYDDGHSFTVQWENFAIRDKGGLFALQMRLQKSGDVFFSYKKIPVPASEIPYRMIYVKEDVNKPIGPGNRSFFSHYAILSHLNISSNTVIAINPLRTCRNNRNCTSCVNDNFGPKCKWCPTIQRCSSYFTKGCRTGCTGDHSEMCRGQTDTCPAQVVTPDDFEGLTGDDY